MVRFWFCFVCLFNNQAHTAAYAHACFKAKRNARGKGGILAALLQSQTERANSTANNVRNVEFADNLLLDVKY